MRWDKIANLCGIFKEVSNGELSHVQDATDYAIFYGTSFESLFFLQFSG